MLQLLQLREIGFHKPQLVEKFQRTKRSISLSLSRTKDVLSPHQSPVNCIDIDHSECRYLLSGGGNSSIAAYDLEEHSKNGEKKTFNPIFAIGRKHEYGISSIQWYSHDNGLFFTGSFDKTVKMWDPNNLEDVLTFNMEGRVYSISLSPTAMSHSLIAVGTSDQKGRLCDIRSGTTAHSLIGHKEAIFSVRWCPGNEFLLATGSQDKTIRFWDVRKGGHLMSLDQHDLPETSITDNKFKLSSPNKPSTATAHNGTVTGLSFTSDGQFLLSTGTDNRLKCWNSSSGVNTLVNFPETKNFSKSSTQMAISKNDMIVYHPNANMINAYHIHTGKLIGTLQGHYEKVNAVAFHPSKEELYSGANDHMILIFSPSEDENEIEEKLVAEDIDNWSDDEKKS